ncbi:hypothetical protein B0T26DRAFT_511345 [Lasiosphaeria miniovina]|uniref:Uncharacterized protein n=1 Tax=Lasiosphaeria miniovina TaxID=1954250 RepID=A0AA40DJK5_9PEZI|nr:uncharacterized protein B0T26DRAFT_511345 [Lasiosphaeria miniovina]KAK0703761.1 hypothetical protein B0T26DRAFT_511345 [Lasiosphaeria miniovina]
MEKNPCNPCNLAPCIASSHQVCTDLLGSGRCVVRFRENPPVPSLRHHAVPARLPQRQHHEAPEFHDVSMSRHSRGRHPAASSVPSRTSWPATINRAPASLPSLSGQKCQAIPAWGKGGGGEGEQSNIQFVTSPAVPVFLVLLLEPQWRQTTSVGGIPWTRNDRICA